MPEVHAVGGEFLDESEIELGFFAHHVAIPFGFEDEVDAHVFDDEVGGGTVGGSECHVDVEQSVVGEVYIIDEAEVVDVDGDLGVVDGFEHFDDLLFEFQFFFGSHRRILCWRVIY